MTKSRTSDSIDAEESDYLYIGASQIPMSGKGLYTAIEIYKDELIATFQGEILSKSEAEKRVKNNRDLYFISMPDGHIFDSMNAQGFAHFANDASFNSSKSKYKNNARIELDANNKISLIAISSIKPGSEIYCSYGKKYWKKHGSPAK